MMKSPEVARTKTKMQRNGLFGLMISASLHIVAIGSVISYATFFPEEHFEPSGAVIRACGFAPGRVDGPFSFTIEPVKIEGRRVFMQDEYLKEHLEYDKIFRGWECGTYFGFGTFEYRWTTRP